MTTHHIGRIVTGCLTAGLVVALALVVGPVAGAQEHVITGTVLLAFASSWALLATLSIVWTEQPQRWAFTPAGFMALAGAALLAFAPSGSVIDVLGWVWPPLLLALIVDGQCAFTGICTVAHGPGSCIRCSLYTRFALLGAAIKPFESRSTAARSGARSVR